MPKVSKIRSPSSKPKRKENNENERTDFYCCRCRRHHTRQKTNYPNSHSPLFRGNNGYLPICSNCLDELYDHYKEALGSGEEAIKRICLKFDIYWSPKVYAMIDKTNTTASRIRTYISKTNLINYIDKTYDDTLDEEYQAQRENANMVTNTDNEYVVADDDTEEGNVGGETKERIVIPSHVLQYWGPGLTPDMYPMLEARRKYWLSKLPEGVISDPAEEALLRQICNLEVIVNKDMANGNPIQQNVNTINSLIGSLNMKPSQKKENEGTYVPFGCEIEKFEEESPIIEEDETFTDVDNIRKNVIAWFTGSLCKTAGIKNEYSDYFDEEIEKYSVKRPESLLDEEEDDVDG